MKKYIFVLMLILLLLLSCSKQKQVRKPITKSAAESNVLRGYYPLPHDQFSLIILNGLPYKVELWFADQQAKSDKILGPGDQNKFFIFKTHQSRFIATGGKVFNERGVVGSVSKVIGIPPQGSPIEGGIWHIISFVKMEEEEDEDKPDLDIRIRRMEESDQ